jgi:hypothetical protein
MTYNPKTYGNCEGKTLSLQNSKDAIEQLYGNDILKHFPNYEVFWEKFIGNPNAEQIEPYRYTLPPNVDSNEKNRILREYERVQMVHYSLFCHLAGAHFQLKELENTKNIQDPKERFFRHWEHYEVGYMHLGSVFYMLESLWKIVLKLKGYPKGFREVEAYLGSKGKNKLIKRLDEVKNVVKIRRDQAVHYGRMFARPHKGRFYVPLKVHKDMKWSEVNKTTKWIETVVKLREDIIETEKLVNALHEILISEYEDFIISKKIRINRDECK